MRLVEIDPDTHAQKRRKPYSTPAVRPLNLTDTPHLVRLCKVARERRPACNGERVYSRTLRLALYASALNDAIAGISVPGDDSATGREPQAVGELDEQRTRRANLECVAKGVVRCLEEYEMDEALSRLGALFGDLGIAWKDRA